MGCVQGTAQDTQDLRSDSSLRGAWRIWPDRAVRCLEITGEQLAALTQNGHRGTRWAGRAEALRLSQPGPAGGAGGEDRQVRPQAGSPPGDGADAPGRDGPGSGGRRGGTPATAPPGEDQSGETPHQLRSPPPGPARTRSPKSHWSPVGRRAAATDPTAGAADVKMMSDVTPRRGGAGRRWRAFPGHALGVAADVGLRCARSRSAAQVAARSSRGRPATVRGASRRGREWARGPGSGGCGEGPSTCTHVTGGEVWVGAAARRVGPRG